MRSRRLRRRSTNGPGAVRRDGAAGGDHQKRVPRGLRVEDPTLHGRKTEAKAGGWGNRCLRRNGCTDRCASRPLTSRRARGRGPIRRVPAGSGAAHSSWRRATASRCRVVLWIDSRAPRRVPLVAWPNPPRLPGSATLRPFHGFNGLFGERMIEEIGGRGFMLNVRLQPHLVQIRKHTFRLARFGRALAFRTRVLRPHPEPLILEQ